MFLSGRIAENMGGYVRGTLMSGAIIGTITWAALTWLGRPFAAPLGAAAAVGELVPYIGPWWRRFRLLPWRYWTRRKRR